MPHMKCTGLLADNIVLALSNLRPEAERAKRMSSSQHQVRLDVESLAEGVDLSVPPCASFEELSHDLSNESMCGF